MKSVLKIVAAVLIAAGLVVAVASLLTLGLVIYGIDFKLAATLLIGGLILLALAKALALLERMSNDLRQLRKTGSEAPPWLRQSAGQSGIQAAALGLAEGAAPAEAAHEGPASEPAQEVGQDIGEQPAAEADWPRATETEWPEVSEVQWPEEPEPEPAEPEATTETESPEAARDEETELPFLGAQPAEHAEFEPEPRYEPEPEPEPEPEEPVASASWVESEPEPADAVDDDAGLPGATEPAEVAPAEHAEEPAEPRPTAPEDTAVEDDAEPPRRLKPSQYTPWSPDEPAEASEEQEPSFASEEPSPEDQSALYVVEERMFRGKQARVLSDGTVEAETAEGWMRFEDFDHLEEYLDAMAELGR